MNNKNSTTEIIELKYPFDIHKLKPKVMWLQEDYSFAEQTVYDVKLFSAVKFESKMLLKKLVKECPQGWAHQMYPWRAKSCLPADSTEVHRLRLTTKYNTFTKQTHTTYELLGLAPAQHNPPEVEEEEL